MALTRARGALPYLLCAAFALLAATAPHWLNWLRTGNGAWFADTDELGLYLQVAARAWFNHPWILSDPLTTTVQPTFYPALQIIPGTALTRLLGLGTVWIGPVMRILGALAISAGWYLVFRHYLRSAWLACGAAVYAMADAWLGEGKPLVKQLSTLAEVGLSRASPLLSNKPLLQGQWRIITPLMSYPFALFYAWAVSRARSNPGRGRIALAGVALGALVYAYFYFWTAAFLGLALALLVDREGRKTYFHVGWIGALVGLPHIVSEYLIKASRPVDWLNRSDKFVHIGRFSELMIPKIGPALLILLAFWIWKKRPELKFLWVNSLAGLLLLDHQILTGLQIENAHWIYYFSLFLAILLLVAAVEGGKALSAARPHWRRPLAAAAAACVVLQAAVSVTLRCREADSGLSRELGQSYRRYVAQRFEGGAARLDGNRVVSGSTDFLLFAAFLENSLPLYSYSAETSPNITDEEIYERDALNDYLLGYTPEQFEGKYERFVNEDYTGIDIWMGPWIRSRPLRETMKRRFVVVFSKVDADPAAAIRRFDVRYVALEPESPMRAVAEKRLAQLGWELFEPGSAWRVWRRPRSSI